MSKTDNKSLRRKYDKIYRDSARKKFFTFSSCEERETILSMADWKGKKVLEIGCGKGDLARAIARQAATVKAIDYSQEAIKAARSKHRLDNLKFTCASWRTIKGRFDIVVMQGVLEHTDSPFKTLKQIKEKLLLNRKSQIITSSPSFLNPRGYIWMTLQLLFSVPMSLTDMHFICPFDMRKFADKLGMRMVYRSSNQSWGNGKGLIIDFQKRLPNALRDAGIRADTGKLLAWLKKAVQYQVISDNSGANIIYRLFFR